MHFRTHRANCVQARGSPVEQAHHYDDDDADDAHLDGVDEDGDHRSSMPDVHN